MVFPHPWIKFPDKFPVCLQSTDIADNEFILHDHLDNINRLFDGETMEQIYTNLEKDGSEWAITQLNTLKKMVSERIYFPFI